MFQGPWGLSIHYCLSVVIVLKWMWARGIMWGANGLLPNLSDNTHLQTLPLFWILYTCKVTWVHLAGSRSYCVDKIFSQTPKHLEKYSNLLLWWLPQQKSSPGADFAMMTHTNRDSQGGNNASNVVAAGENTALWVSSILRQDRSVALCGKNLSCKEFVLATSHFFQSLSQLVQCHLC